MKGKGLFNNRNRAFFPIAIWVLMFVWCAIFFVMFFWGILTSLKTQTSFWMDPVGLPMEEFGGWRFDNYLLVFQYVRQNIPAGRWVYLPEMLYNTLFYCLVYGLIILIGPMITSYVYSKYAKKEPWVRIVWIIFMINTYVPLSASLGASIRLAMQMGYYDNLYLFTFVHLSGFGGSFLIYYAIWKGLSWDYAEAAIMDGAGPWTVFLRVMFPMTKTVFIVLYVTEIVGLWANYTTPMIYLRSYPTLAVGVFNFQQSYEAGAASSVPVKVAALITVAVPMFALFMVFREKMMGTLTLGGLKG
ncbi:MAG: carbohydrate ABC transporter permease [Clostridia bacterium]|nr:carbohydrate ABC transporter permease [Clostridia bacterium]